MGDEWLTFKSKRPKRSKQNIVKGAVARKRWDIKDECSRQMIRMQANYSRLVQHSICRDEGKGEIEMMGVHLLAKRGEHTKGEEEDRCNQKLLVRLMVVVHQWATREEWEEKKSSRCSSSWPSLGERGADFGGRGWSLAQAVADGRKVVFSGPRGNEMLLKVYLPIAWPSHLLLGEHTPILYRKGVSSSSSSPCAPPSFFLPPKPSNAIPFKVRPFLFFLSQGGKLHISIYHSQWSCLAG